MGCGSSGSDFDIDESYMNEAVTLLNQPIKDYEDNDLPIKYVLLFSAGNCDPNYNIKPTTAQKKRKKEDDMDSEWENGMPQNKYFGAIFNNCCLMLENEMKYVVEMYKSKDETIMYLAFAESKQFNAPDTVKTDVNISGDGIPYGYQKVGDALYAQRCDVNVNKLVCDSKSQIQAFVSHNDKTP
eukprot:817707_1